MPLCRDLLSAEHTLTSGVPLTGRGRALEWGPPVQHADAAPDHTLRHQRAGAADRPCRQDDARKVAAAQPSGQVCILLICWYCYELRACKLQSSTELAAAAGTPACVEAGQVSQAQGTWHNSFGQLAACTALGPLPLGGGPCAAGLSSLLCVPAAAVAARKPAELLPQSGRLGDRESLWAGLATAAAPPAQRWLLGRLLSLHHPETCIHARKGWRLSL